MLARQLGEAPGLRARTVGKVKMCNLEPPIFCVIGASINRAKTDHGLFRMFTGFKKIVKPDGQKPTEFENTVAQELFNLEMSASDIKADLRDL